MMRTIVSSLVAFLSLMIVVGCTRHQKFEPTRWVPDNTVASNAIRILVVDSQGKPIVGAIVGDCEECCDTDVMFTEELRQRLGGIRIPISDRHKGILSFSSGQSPQISGQDGMVTIPDTALIIGDPKCPTNRYTAILVLHPDRKIGALVSVRRIDLGACATVVLYPLCAVSGSFSRSDGEPVLKNFIGPDGKPVTHALVQTTVLWVPPWSPVGSHHSFTGSYEILLPPGQYCLLFNPIIGFELGERRVQVNVRPGQLVIRKDIQLPEDRPDRYTFTPDRGASFSGRGLSIQKQIREQKGSGRLVILADIEGVRAYEEVFYREGQCIRSARWRDGWKQSESMITEKEGRKYGG